MKNLWVHIFKVCRKFYNLSSNDIMVHFCGLKMTVKSTKILTPQKLLLVQYACMHKMINIL